MKKRAQVKIAIEQQLRRGHSFYRNTDPLFADLHSGGLADPMLIKRIKDANCPSLLKRVGISLKLATGLEAKR